MNSNFESQLSASARRLREAQDARLTTDYRGRGRLAGGEYAPRHNYRSSADSNCHLPAEEPCDSPKAKKRPAWHWLTIPVAVACVFRYNIDRPTSSPSSSRHQPPRYSPPLPMQAAVSWKTAQTTPSSSLSNRTTINDFSLTTHIVRLKSITLITRIILNAQSVRRQRPSRLCR